MYVDDITTDDDNPIEDESRYLYRVGDDSYVITRYEFVELLISGERGFTILCRDSEEGILPFLVAEDETYFDDLYAIDDSDGVGHLLVGLPVPSHFGLTDDDSLMELAACASAIPILRKFRWCVFTPLGDDPAKGFYELRFATKSHEDAEFVAGAFGCCNPLIVQVVDPAIDAV